MKPSKQFLLVTGIFLIAISLLLPGSIPTYILISIGILIIASGILNLLRERTTQGAALSSILLSFVSFVMNILIGLDFFMYASFVFLFIAAFLGITILLRKRKA